jgi:hypothetical protein
MGSSSDTAFTGLVSSIFEQDASKAVAARNIVIVLMIILIIR